MDLAWVNVADTAVKIGFGALISALAAYIALIRSQSHEDQKEDREHFYKRQEEKKGSSLFQVGKPKLSFPPMR